MNTSKRKMTLMFIAMKMILYYALYDTDDDDADDANTIMTEVNLTVKTMMREYC